MGRKTNKAIAEAYAEMHGIEVTYEPMDDHIEVWSYGAHLRNDDPSHTYFAKRDSWRGGRRTDAAMWRDVYEYMLTLTPCPDDCECRDTPVGSVALGDTFVIVDDDTDREDIPVAGVKWGIVAGTLTMDDYLSEDYAPARQAILADYVTTTEQGHEFGCTHCRSTFTIVGGERDAAIAQFDSYGFVAMLGATWCDECNTLIRPRRDEN